MVVMRHATLLNLTFLGFALGFALLGCGGGGGSNVIRGSTSGGSVDLEIDDGAQSGVESAHIPPSIITVLGQDATTGAISLYFAGFRDEGNGFSSKMWQIQLILGDAPVAGNVYQLATPTSGEPPAGTLQLEEDDRYADWSAAGGSVSVDSVISGRATFTATSAAMTPMFGASLVSPTSVTPTSGAATGGFLLSGQLVIANLGAICQCSD